MLYRHLCCKYLYCKFYGALDQSIEIEQRWDWLHCFCLFDGWRSITNKPCFPLSIVLLIYTAKATRNHIAIIQYSKRWPESIQCQNSKCTVWPKRNPSKWLIICHNWLRKGLKHETWQPLHFKTINPVAEYNTDLKTWCIDRGFSLIVWI